jgi:hypothetical protein
MNSRTCLSVWVGRRGALVVTVLVVLLTAVLSAVDGDKAMYVGGTVVGLKEKTEGRLVTTSETSLKFEAGSKGSATIPYATVTSLEYGQKAGRRVGVAIMVSPLALFSKKRNHFLTIAYKDSTDKEQAAVFELGKDIFRTTLKILEVRTGKEIELQDNEACRQFKTPKECEGK